VSRFAAVNDSISVVCTKDLEIYTVDLGAGENTSAGRRRMESGSGHFLEYDVFKRSGDTVWGNAVGARATNAAPGHGVNAEEFEHQIRIYTISRYRPWASTLNSS